MNARVAHISVVHKPDDPRILDRECRTLAEAGYAVTFFAPGPVPETRRDGVSLVPLPRRQRSTRWMSVRDILRDVQLLRPQVVHLHDPELLTAVPLLRPIVPRIVYDMHEYLGNAVESKYYIPAAARSSAAAATLRGQRSLAALCDGLVVVIDSQYEDVGSRPSLRAVVPNYPRLSRFAAASPIPDLAADDRLKLVYVGSLTRNRGVDLMLDVMSQAADAAVLYLGGEFPNPSFEEEVRRRVASELAGCVRLLGRVDPTDVPSLLASADVMWVPLVATSQYKRPAIATKMLEGMARGLAVLSSNLPGGADVVREEECGLVVAPDADGHLAGLRRLAANRGAAAEMGRRARRAVEQRYCWEAVQARLLDFYAQLLAAS